MRKWSDFDKFEALSGKYLPAQGEGENMATQHVTAVCKLVYKWFNDGDVYDNRYALEGWANDLSSYANWLHGYGDSTVAGILERISDINTEDEYVDLLWDLAEHVINEDYLNELAARKKEGSVYEALGPFRFAEYEDEYDDDEY